MALIHHVVTGQARPSVMRPIVFVHGFACAHSDWDAQVAQLSPRHQTVAVDLRGHGASPGTPEQCSIERIGADVAELLGALDLSGVVLVGHSMGCRVVTEAALQAPGRIGGVILVDGSQFTPAMEPVLRERFATAEGYAATIEGLFTDMFTASSDPKTVQAVVARARALPPAIGAKLLTDLLRYDVTRFTASLACLRMPVMALQTTHSNEKRERSTMQTGQSSPFLDMVRECLPAARIEIIADTGHFPQLDQAARTNEVIGEFLGSLPSSRAVA